MAKVPRLTPCGHIVGSNCLENWLHRVVGETCPICRALLLGHGPEHIHYQEISPDDVSAGSEESADNTVVALIDNGAVEAEGSPRPLGSEFGPLHFLTGEGDMAEGPLETYRLA